MNIDTHVSPDSVQSTGVVALDVLVVDPDSDARALYRHWLEPGNARVHEATDGRDALVKIFAIHPHVVVLDARLPFIDGLQLCALLRDDSTTASLRIVAITGDGSPDHIRRFREHGADVVFVKPVPGNELASAVYKHEKGVSTVGAAASSAERTDAKLPFMTRTVAKARSRERYVSTSPPQSPPHLRCPQCDAALQYDRSHVGGVSDRHPEQWDYFVCATHGVFQYRHRTRKLRSAS
jgi:CheY-like chemotaxis protein